MHGTIDDETVLDERPKVGVVEREQAIDAGAHRAGDDEQPAGVARGEGTQLHQERDPRLPCTEAETAPPPPCTAVSGHALD